MPPENTPGAGTSGAPAATAPPAAPTAAEIATAVQAVLAKQGGDPQSALQAATRRALTLRARVRELEAAAPPQGSRVLTAEQAAAYDAFVALNVPAADISTRLSRLGELETQVAAQETANLHREAAEVAKYRPKVLSDLIAARGLKVALKDVTVDGKATRQAVVVAEGGSETELTAWVTANAPEHLPALQDSGATPAPVVLPSMPSGGAPAKDSVLARFLAAQEAARKAKPNPLAPAAAK